MKLRPDPSSLSWLLKMTFACSLMSNALSQIDPDIITNTSQYQCVVRTIPDLGVSNVGLELKNRSKGVVLGTFDHKENYEDYFIILHRRKDLPKESCNAQSGGFRTYISYKFSTSDCREINDCNAIKCKKVVEVHFWYITSGCYNFEVNVESERTMVIHETHHFMETDYRFSNFKNRVCGGKSERNMNNLTLRAEMEDFVVDDTARLDVCYSSNKDEPCPSQNSFYISMNESKVTNNEQQLEYYVGRKNFRLTLVNASQTINYIQIKLQNDIRCSLDLYYVLCDILIVVKETCKPLQSTTTPPNFEEIHTNLLSRLWPLFILPLIFISSLVIAKRLIFKNPADDQDTDLNKKEKSEKYTHTVDIMDIERRYCDETNGRDFVGRKDVNKILLVYSQDCEEFMEVMRNFRILLRDVMKFKVYDCFDPDLFETAARDKYGWIDLLIRCQDTGVILVETPMAVIIDQITATRHLNAKYTNPTMFSDVFTYTMKQIRNPTINSYDKIAVIRFEEYTDDQFSLLENKCVRFSIPTSLQDLFRHFSRIRESPDFSDTCIEVQCLKDCLEKLGDFRAKNVNHVKSIINL